MNDQEVTLETFTEFDKRFESLIQSAQRAEQNLDGLLKRVEYKSVEAVEKHMKNWWNQKKDKDLEQAVGRKLNEFSEDTKKLQDNYLEVLNPASLWLENLKSTVESLHEKYTEIISISEKTDMQIDALKTVRLWFDETKIGENFETLNTVLNERFEVLKRSFLEVMTNEIELAKETLQKNDPIPTARIESAGLGGAHRVEPIEESQKPPSQGLETLVFNESPENRIRQKFSFLDAMIADSEKRILDLETKIRKIVEENSLKQEKDEALTKSILEDIRMRQKGMDQLRGSFAADIKTAEEKTEEARKASLEEMRQSLSNRLNEAFGEQKIELNEAFEQMRLKGIRDSQLQKDFLIEETEKSKKALSLEMDAFRKWGKKTVEDVEKEKEYQKKIFKMVTWVSMLGAGFWVGTAFWISLF